MSARTKHWAVARLMVGVALTLAFVSTAFGAPSLAPQKPTITAISPQRGPVGTTVTITGSNLIDVNSVAFWSEVAARYKNDGRVLFESAVEGLVGV